MKNMIIVKDNFYDKPDLVRNFAINSDYDSAAVNNYPGFQSRKQFENQTTVKKIEELIDTEMEEPAGKFAFGEFRLITEETGVYTKVHADTIIDWAGLLFLTPDAPIMSGIGLYKHKETGLYGPPSDSEARSLGYQNAEEFEEKVAKVDMADKNKWELVGYVGNVYNRMVLIRGGEMYHAPMRGFGSSPNDCRITQNFFFKERLKLATGVLKL